MLSREKTVWIVAAFMLTAATLATAGYVSIAKAEVPASITNLDQKAHQLKVEEGENQREIMIEPNQAVSDLCVSTCLLIVGDDPEPYEVVANDKISIEEGLLVYQSDESEDQTSDENGTDADLEPEPAPEGDGEATVDE